MYSNGHVVVDTCMFVDQEKRDATNTLVEAACGEKCIAKQKCNDIIVAMQMAHGLCTMGIAHNQIEDLL